MWEAIKDAFDIAAPALIAVLSAAVGLIVGYGRGYKDGRRHHKRIV
jgi:hypothetical protein